MDKWNHELEEAWRCRLLAIKDEKQPFRNFIQKAVECEILEAFTAALSEIERLRQELSSAKQQLDQSKWPQDTANNGSICTSAMEVYPHNDSQDNVGQKGY
jgi:hypothetical protein